MIFALNQIVIYAVRNERTALLLQNVLLLCGGLLFFLSYGSAHLIYALYMIVLTWLSGAFVQKNRKLLPFFLIPAFLPLFLTKYFELFFKVSLSLTQPVGVSYVTLQCVTYMVSVKRGKIKPERNLLTMADFVVFFPVISSGPIQSAENLIPKIREKRNFDYMQVTDGMIRFAWGMLKKCAVADVIGAYVDQVYGTIGVSYGTALVAAIVLFAFQLFMDFSGYSDMAIGCAKMLGFDIPENFDHPFLSTSYTELWTRWHISLSSWLRDYIYIPLGGSRVPMPGILLNTLITFTISGLWHGAAWHYVVWGFACGVVVCVERLLGIRKRKSMPGKLFGILITMVCFIVTFILFRIPSMSVLPSMADSLSRIPVEIRVRVPLHNLLTPAGVSDLSLYKSGVVLLAAVCLAEILTRKEGFSKTVRKMPLAVRWMIYLLIMFVVFFFSSKSSSGNFIYNGF